MPPASSAAEQRRAIQTALADFARLPLPGAAYAMLAGLGYRSEKTADLGIDAETFLSSIEQFKPELGKISRDKVKSDHWKSCAFLFQLTNDEIPPLSLPSPASGRGGGGEGARSEDIARSQIESFVFLAIELQGESWSRTDLAAIVRELNRRFPMPAIVIFKHGLPSPAGGRGVGGEGISLAVIDRRANLKDAAKDVIDSRITVIKDVRIANPHRAHLDILASIALENLGDKRRPTNFRELYDAWIEALSTQALNKRFYQELANWYFWALTQAQFPKDAPKDADGRDSLSLIRLITRIIFCWFLKEKGLLPDALFDPRKIATLLNDDSPNASTYYKAILQNLFFATLNQEMDKRVFRKAGQNFMAHNLYRYRSLLKNPDEVLKLLAGIPFMNGGLFECLDKTLGTKEKPTYVRIDGFSDRDDNPLKMPNDLFFGDERVVDLSDAYGDNKFKAAKVAGLIHILDRYKFTVAENTPIEEEVALDPELLGKVFENLLAAYNPETGATARKQTGSFYTPREIVNYMVDESLIASLERHLPPSPACGTNPPGADLVAPSAPEGFRAGRPGNKGAGGEGVRADAQPPLPHPPAKLPDDIRRYARELRTGQTDAESLLWHLLRNRQFLDLKFRRQHPEGRYILDFYCDELKLVIELDGSQHFEQAGYDQVRTEFLAKQGIRVLRFWNNQVLVETEGVLEAIYQAVMEMQAPSPPTPLQPAGEGSAVARGEGGRAGEACSAPPAGEGSENRLRHLFAYNDQPHPFAAAEVEALIEAIDHLKILDPACGSGAFPMGVLHKLVFVLGKLDPGNRLWKARQLAKASEIPDATVRERVMNDIEQTFGANELDYGRKLYLIENCIYGVDIQPIAVQITKLRFFISLVVEQKINPQADNLGIRPLPNLETKFVAANTLIGINRPGQQLLRNLDIDIKEAELRRVRERHFLARTPTTKAKCREQDATLRAEIAGLLKSDGWNTVTACALAEWNPYDQNASADFFDLEWMFGMMEGFDVAIGNPPYVRADEPSDENKRLRERILASRQYETLWEKWDLFVPFIEKGFKLLKSGGITTMIVSDAYCHSKYAQKSQSWFLKNSRVLRLDFCADLKIFDAAVHNVIYFFQKADGVHHTPERRAHRETFGKVTTLPSDEQEKLTYRAFFPEEKTAQSFAGKFVELDSICYVTIGMVVNAHEDLAQGTFSMDDLVRDTQDATHPKRFVEGKHLGMWLPTTHRWLEWGTARAPALFRRQTFPEIYETGEKILVQRSPGPDPKCCYDDQHLHFTESTVTFIPWCAFAGVRNNSLKKTARYRGETPPRPDLPKREELEATSRRFAVKYLLGVMNSSTARDFLRANRRSNIHLYPDDWKNLPIPDVSPQQQQPIVTLVEQILTAKRANPDADISTLEAELDHAVALLYGTTP